MRARVSASVTTINRWPCEKPPDGARRTVLTIRSSVSRGIGPVS